MKSGDRERKERGSCSHGWAGDEGTCNTASVGSHGTCHRVPSVNSRFLCTNDCCVHLILCLAKCENLSQLSTDHPAMILTSVKRSFVPSSLVSASSLAPEKLNWKSPLRVWTWYRWRCNVNHNQKFWYQNWMMIRESSDGTDHATAQRLG